LDLASSIRLEVKAVFGFLLRVWTHNLIQ
jgi:hypothetical protein